MAGLRRRVGGGDGRRVPARASAEARRARAAGSAVALLGAASAVATSATGGGSVDVVVRLEEYRRSGGGGGSGGSGGRSGGGRSVSGIEAALRNASAAKPLLAAIEEATAEYDAAASRPNGAHNPHNPFLHRLCSTLVRPLSSRASPALLCSTQLRRARRRDRPPHHLRRRAAARARRQQRPRRRAVRRRALRRRERRSAEQPSSCALSSLFRTPLTARCASFRLSGAPVRSIPSRRRWASEGTRRRSGAHRSPRRCRAAPSTTTARRTRLLHHATAPLTCDPHISLTPHVPPRDRRHAVRVVQHYGRLSLRRPPVRRAAGLAVARLLAAPRRRRPRRRRRGARARRAVDRPVVRPLGRRRQRRRAAAGAGEHAAGGGGGGAAGRGRRRPERAALRSATGRVPRPVGRVRYF